jgi:hypothetical protein
VREKRPPTPAQIRARRKNGKKMSARVRSGDVAAKFVDEKPSDPEQWGRAMRREGR